MFKRFLKKVLWVPTIHMPVITFPKIGLPKVRIPTISIPLKRVSTILGAINTSLLVVLGVIGLFISYINPIPSITPYISLGRFL